MPKPSSAKGFCVRIPHEQKEGLGGGGGKEAWGKEASTRGYLKVHEWYKWVMHTLDKVITIVTLLLTLLRSNHGPPSRVEGWQEGPPGQAAWYS